MRSAGTRRGTPSLSPECGTEEGAKLLALGIVGSRSQQASSLEALPDHEERFGHFRADRSDLSIGAAEGEPDEESGRKAGASRIESGRIYSQLRFSSGIRVLLARGK